jgi:hypothetical protein
MSRQQMLKVLSVSLLLVGVGHDLGTSAQGGGTREFRGRVGDIDFLSSQGWTQVILRGDSPSSELVASTNDAILQSALQVAFMLGRSAVVGCAPCERDARRPPSTDEGSVLEIACEVSAKGCAAKIFYQGKVVTVSARETRAEGVLLTAMTQSIPVHELSFSNANVITRVKVNMP